MKSLAEQPIYDFSEFRLDPSRRLLTRNGETLALHGKAFDLLLVLIENRDRLLLKDELLESVWEGQFVEENNLAVQISVLRKVFHESGKTPRFIVTVPGKGYRFVADVKNGNSRYAVHPAIGNGNGGDLRTGSANGTIHDLPEDPSEHSSQLTRSSGRLQKSAIIAVILAAAAIVLYIAFRQGAVGVPLAANNNQPRIRQLTTQGRVALAAISPDGEFYVYTTDLVGERKRRLWIAHTKGGKEIELRPPDDNLISGVAFSPDGETVYFTLSSTGESEGGLFQIPILGGVEKKLADSPRNAFALSPDGTQVAYFQNKTENDDATLVVQNLDGTDRREVVTRPAGKRFQTRAPAWSPDGSMLAAGAIENESKQSGEIFIARVADGQTQQLTNLDWKLLYNLVWRPDARGLIAVAIDKAETMRHVWQINYPNGAVTRLSSDVVDYGQALSISADGKSLIAVQVSAESNIWVAPAGDLSKARQISFSSINGAFGWDGVEWTRDNRIVFTAGVQRNRAIFTIGSDGGDVRQITSNGFYDSQPTVAPDGRTVIFSSDRSGTNEIWRVDIDGTGLRQLTTGGGLAPDVTPDGTRILYILNRSGKDTLWSAPVTGGESLQLTREETLDPKVSPDGTLVACGYRADNKSPLRLAILNIQDGSPVRMYDMPPSTNFNGGINWMPDSKAVTIRDWANGVWKQAVGGGPPTVLEGLPQEKLYGYDWSADGRLFAYSRGRGLADAVLITLDADAVR